MKDSLRCTNAELDLLEKELKIIKINLLIGGIFALAIALVAPWLGSSKTHGKPMVDYMSYPEAVLSILLVLGLIMTSYYFMSAPKIKADLREKVKLILQTSVAKKETLVYRKIKGAYITLNSAPGTLKRVAVTPAEFEDFKEKDGVIIEYFKNSKKIISVKNLRIEKDTLLKRRIK